MNDRSAKIGVWAYLLFTLASFALALYLLLAEGGLFILLQSLVSAAPLPVKPLVPRWQFDCPGEVKDSFVIQLHSGKAQAPIAVHLRSLL